MHLPPRPSRSFPVHRETEPQVLRRRPFRGDHRFLRPTQAAERSREQAQKAAEEMEGQDFSLKMVAKSRKAVTDSTEATNLTVHHTNLVAPLL